MSILDIETLNHHSYLLIGEKDKVLNDLKTRLGRSNVIFSGNPDLYLEEFEIFSVEDSRKLFFRQSQKPLQSEKNIFVVLAKDITPEAQNALLKFFEEPTSNSIFFLIVPGQDKILETLKSRCVTLICGGQESGSKEFAEEFLKAQKPDRLKLIDKKSSLFRKQEKPQAKEFRVLLEAIESQLKELTGGRPMTKEEVAAFDWIFEAKDQLLLPVSSAKMIFEHLALITPNFD